MRLLSEVERYFINDLQTRRAAFYKILYYLSVLWCTSCFFPIWWEWFLWSKSSLALCLDNWIHGFELLSQQYLLSQSVSKFAELIARRFLFYFLSFDYGIDLAKNLLSLNYSTLWLLLTILLFFTECLIIIFLVILTSTVEWKTISIIIVIVIIVMIHKHLILLRETTLLHSFHRWSTTRIFIAKRTLSDSFNLLFSWSFDTRFLFLDRHWIFLRFYRLLKYA